MSGGSGRLVIPVVPVPASRPRVSRWGSYYGKKYTKWRIDAQAFLETVKSEVAKGNLQVAIEHVCKKPAKVTRINPNGDIDNYDKAPLDAITSHCDAWEDDMQINFLTSIKRYADAKEQPHTCVWILGGIKEAEKIVLMLLRRAFSAR